jgi:glycosyltransferase involved in cell wall biosynthesis
LGGPLGRQGNKPADFKVFIGSLEFHMGIKNYPQHPTKKAPSPTNQEALRPVMLLIGIENYGGRSAALNWLKGLTLARLKPVALCLKPGPFYQELKESGYHVELVTIPESTIFFKKILGSQYQRFLTAWGIFFSRGVAREVLLDKLRALRASLLHVQSPDFFSLAGWVAQRMNIPCVWEVTRTMSRYPLSLNTFLVKMACLHWKILVLANSSYTAGTLWKGKPYPRVCYLGVEVPKIQRASSNKNRNLVFKIKKNIALVGVFARVTEEKGQDRLLRALKLVPELPLKLLIVGEILNANYKKKILDLLKDPLLRRKVVLLGPVKSSFSLMAACDFTINCIVGAEALGLSVLESMSVGKPVLAAGKGGPQETIFDGQTGWLVPECDPEKIAQALRRAFAERNHWKAMGQTARLRIQNHFSLKNWVGTYLNELLSFYKNKDDLPRGNP